MTITLDPSALAPAEITVPEPEEFPETIMLTVTEADIRRGLPYRTSSCPVALALCRYFGMTPDSAITGRNIIFVYYRRAMVYLERNGNVWGRYNLLESDSRFVRDFDDGKRVQPTTMTLTRALTWDHGRWS